MIIMRFCTAILFAVTLLISVVSVANAETFTIKIETMSADDVVTTSTNTVTLPNIMQQESVDEAIASILKGLGVDEQLGQLWVDFEAIKTNIEGAISVDPIDVDTLAEQTTALQELTLHLQLYILQQALLNLPQEYGTGDTWLFKKIFSNDH